MLDPLKLLDKKFIFTVFDDTDLSEVGNVREVYALLYDLGLRTTKSVWPLKGGRVPKTGGATCEDKEYYDWVLSLKNRGFEIGFHNAAYHTSCRQNTIEGLERFKELFGDYPKSMANHADCREGIYWGDARITGWNKEIYNLLTCYKNKKYFRGHIQGDPLFWGDLCQKHIQFVRNFVFLDINTLKMCPMMPYYDPQRSYVNYWYASSNGGNLKSFVACIGEKEQDRLEAEGGCCIMYTHFGKGFQEGNKINTRFRFLMERLAKKGGWFMPVSSVLDYLLTKNGRHVITDQERFRLERVWLFEKIFQGTN